MQPAPIPEPLTLLDEIQRKRWQSLLAVDDLVEKLVLKLSELNAIESTFIMFTSDNGFHVGQYSLPWDKRQPYDTDIRVPFIIRGPGIPRKGIYDNPITSVDIAPSLLTIGNVPTPIDMDGRSFIMPLKVTLKEHARNLVFIQYFGEYGTNSVSEQCPWTYDKNLTVSIYIIHSKSLINFHIKTTYNDIFFNQQLIFSGMYH